MVAGEMASSSRLPPARGAGTVCAADWATGIALDRIAAPLALISQRLVGSASSFMATSSLTPIDRTPVPSSATSSHAIFLLPIMQNYVNLKSFGSNRHDDTSKLLEGRLCSRDRHRVLQLRPHAIGSRPTAWRATFAGHDQ